MKKILIFKTDRLGDLLNISPIINNIKINFPECEIDLICSKYNKSIANYFSRYVNIIVFRRPFIFFLLSNFNKFFFNKYDLIIQLDGKNHSYLSTIFIRSKKKICIQYSKLKSILGKKFTILRPNNIVRLFFSNSLNCIEDYNISNNKDFHYLSLYLKLISLENIKIVNQNHFLPIVLQKKIPRFNEEYFYLHIDERWNNFEKKAFDNINYAITKLSNNEKIVISSNIGGNNVFNKIDELFRNNLNIEIIKDPSIDDLISLIYYSHTCISSHSGLVVHLSAALKKRIIDIVPRHIFDELDRWIPFNVNYKRLDILNFSNQDLYSEVFSRKN
jgi:ADP-heptose:LPS heptosyltransferase